MEYVKWTPELEAQLRDLWEEGMTATAIAQELPAMMTRNAVLGKVRRLALPKRA